jgi:hypothetical protein
MQQQQILLYIAVGFCILFVWKYFTSHHMEHLDNSDSLDGMNAAQACQKISTRADEIKAQMDGYAKVAQNANPFAFLNPQSYKGGDNTSDNMMRNILNTNISTEENTKIQNTCNNSSVGSQINSLDNSNCPACQTHPELCTFHNITQSNSATSNQSCLLQATTSALLQKSSSIDAQALAKALQKSQDALSGNNSSSNQQCNVVNTNMTAKQYLEQITKCANQNSLDQNNTIKACGQVFDVIQKNSMDNIQKCVISSTSTVQDTSTSDSKASGSATTEQTSIGINTTYLMIAVALCCCSSFCTSSLLAMVGSSTVQDNPQLLAAAMA